MPFASRCRVFAVLLVLAVAGIVRAQDAEHWYRVLISGTPAGWSRAEEITSGGLITSRGEMTFKLRRGPIDMAITMRSEFVETTDGKPVSMTLHQELGALPIDSKYKFVADGIEVETIQSGQTTKSKRPLPSGDWLCPSAAGRELRDRIAKGEKVIVLSSIDPLGGMEVLKMTHKIIGPETIVIAGKPVKTTKATVETSQMPGLVSTEYLDETTAPVRSETSIGGMQMTLVKAGPEVKNDSGEAPELMVSTFVTPDKPIHQPRTLKSATYILSKTEGDMPVFPTTGAQSVEKVDATHVRLKVSTQGLAPAPAADAADAVFLASTTSANFEDTSVKKLATRGVKDAGDDKAKRAEALRRYVYKFIKTKSLDVGFATASEVARTRTGDCSEHGVLLATLLRADGIPSRVAVGLIYADSFAGHEGIFGYHMWSQALLDVDGQKRWVDLDATLPDSTPFDATHLALGISNLSDEGGMESMAGLLNVLGTLKISVEAAQ